MYYYVLQWRHHYGTDSNFERMDEKHFVMDYGGIWITMRMPIAKFRIKMKDPDALPQPTPETFYKIKT